MDADGNEEGRGNDDGVPNHDAAGYDAADYDEPSYDAAGNGEPGYDASDPDAGYDDGDGYDEGSYETAGFDGAAQEWRDYRADGDDGPDPGDGDWSPRDDGAYWRRRFLILCGGAVALGVCAYLFPGAHAAPAPSPAARASMAARVSAQALPPAATGAAWDVTPAAKPGPTATAAGLSTAPAKFAATAKPGATATKTKEKVGTAYHPSTSPTGSGTAGQGKAKATPSGHPSGSAKPPRPGAKTPQCAPADVVLSLVTSKTSYTSGERPTFSVLAVSTMPKACSLSYGPGSVKVVVTRSGRVVWDSAACRPPAAKSVRFTLGVPQVLKLSWNRKAASPGGCAGGLPAGATGTLQAVVKRGGQSSKAAAFKLTK